MSRVTKLNPQSTTSVAFLRGINVGGSRLIKMEDLRQAFASAGFTNAKTLIASGNVIFHADEGNERALGERLEQQLKESFGHETGVILRTAQEIQALVDSNPFARIKVTPLTRLFVTFLQHEPDVDFKTPYVAPRKDFKILRVSGRDVISVFTVSPEKLSMSSLNILEKTFGRKVTTRTWGTVTKVLAAMKTYSAGSA